MMTSSTGNIFRVTGHLCGTSPVTGELPAQRPVTRSFDVFFDLRLIKRLSKQSRGWWFETPSRPLWRHCNASKWLPVRHEGSLSLTWFNFNADMYIPHPDIINYSHYWWSELENAFRILDQQPKYYCVMELFYSLFLISRIADVVREQRKLGGGGGGGGVFNMMPLLADVIVLLYCLSIKS